MGYGEFLDRVEINNRKRTEELSDLRLLLGAITKQDPRLIIRLPGELAQIDNLEPCSEERSKEIRAHAEKLGISKLLGLKGEC